MEHRIHSGLFQLERELGLPLVATNQPLYHHAGRRSLSDVVVSIREHVPIAKAGFLLAPNAERHLKDAREMRRLFQDYPEAIENVRKIYGSKLNYFAQPYGALEGADALAIMTEWKQFLQPDFTVMRSLMRSPVIFDARNVYNPAHMKAYGFTYHSIGRATVR